MRRPFRQVDVFTDTAFGGNPVAVVLDATGLDDDEMRRIARWTNLSETTFVLAPTEPGADYRVRIFTPVTELPFAGHPTLGTCHAWLEAGGAPRDPEAVVQQCAAGHITIRRIDGRLAFGAPPLVRSGPIEPDVLTAVLDACGLDQTAVLAAEWVDNGPGWLALLVDDPATVLACRPNYIDQDVGLVALHPAAGPAAIEVRAFFPKDGALAEDPVTGSLNASVAQWLLGSGRLTAPYVAAQGTVLGRDGRVHVSHDDEGIWIGGGTVTRVDGTIDA
jgi:PhzF family phenazine biosynthesis protein